MSAKSCVGQWKAGSHLKGWESEVMTTYRNNKKCRDPHSTNNVRRTLRLMQASCKASQTARPIDAEEATCSCISSIHAACPCLDVRRYSKPEDADASWKDVKDAFLYILIYLALSLNRDAGPQAVAVIERR